MLGVFPRCLLVLTTVLCSSALRLESEKMRWPFSSEKKVPLVVIPGFGGQEDRVATTEANLVHLRQNLEEFDCVVYMYQAVDIDLKRLQGCHVVDHEAVLKQKNPMVLSGHLVSSSLATQIEQVHKMAKSEGGRLGELRLWTFWMKMVDRTLIEKASHVLLLLDDVDIVEVDTAKMLRTMATNEVTTASPHTTGSPHQIMVPHEGSTLGYYVKFLEPQFMIYSPENYKCWQDMIDLQINPHGWGYDLTFQSACNPKMARIDNSGVSHHHTETHLYNGDSAGPEAQAYLDTVAGPRGWEIASTQDDSTLGPLEKPDPLA